MEKKPVAAITAGVLVIAAGFVFLMDDLNVAFNGAIEYWYLVLIIWIACNLLSLAVIYKSPIYYCLAVTLGGVFLSITLSVTVNNLKFENVWPIIPLFFGIGIIVANVVGNKVVGFLKSGILITLFSAALLIGSVMNVWRIVLPAVVMAGGICIILNTLINYNKKNKDKDDDYYVTPTREKEKNEESHSAD